MKKPNANPPEQGVSGHINRVIADVQRKSADYLNQKTAGWSVFKLKIVLILFCLLTGNLILFITGKAILAANGPPKIFKEKLHQTPLIGPVLKEPPKVDTGSKNQH